MALPRPLVAARMNMIRRCMHINHRSYSYCGGRGIRVCEEWLKSSRAFYDWALSNGYAVGLYLDRIDNDLGYSASNCRFITPTESARNRRNNVMITAWGETKHQKDWISDERCTQKSPSIIKRELATGNSGEIALTYHGIEGKPSVPITAWGETKRLQEWLQDPRCLANRFQIRTRIAQGIRSEDALRCGNGYRIVNDRGTIRLKLIPRL